jgi:hypothetical protein
MTPNVHFKERFRGTPSYEVQILKIVVWYGFRLLITDGRNRVLDLG